MMNNIYLYYYDDYSQLLNCIKEFKIKDVFLSEEYDKYEVHINEYNNITLYLFRNMRIIAISCNRYKEIRELNIISNLKKVNILDKRIFNILLKNNFSRNLCKIVIDIDILGNDEELIEFNGYKLSDLDLLDAFEIGDINSSTKLKLYSIQPFGYKDLVTFKATNKVEFSKKYNSNEIEEIFLDLIHLITVVVGGK